MISFLQAGQAFSVKREKQGPNGGRSPWRSLSISVLGRRRRGHVLLERSESKIHDRSRPTPAFPKRARQTEELMTHSTESSILLNDRGAAGAFHCAIAKTQQRPIAMKCRPARFFSGFPYIFYIIFVALVQRLCNALQSCFHSSLFSPLDLRRSYIVHSSAPSSNAQDPLRLIV